jgi:hypothetical protein
LNLELTESETSLWSEAFSNAIGGSSNECPRSILFEVFGLPEKIDIDPVEKKESKSENCEETKGEGE